MVLDSDSPSAHTVAASLTQAEIEGNQSPSENPVANKIGDTENTIPQVRICGSGLKSHTIPIVTDRVTMSSFSWTFPLF